VGDVRSEGESMRREKNASLYQCERSISIGRCVGKGFGKSLY